MSEEENEFIFKERVGPGTPVIIRGGSILVELVNNATGNDDLVLDPTTGGGDDPMEFAHSQTGAKVLNVHLFDTRTGTPVLFSSLKVPEAFGDDYVLQVEANT